MQLNDTFNTPATRGVYCAIDDLIKLRNLAKDLRLQTRSNSSAIMDGDSRTRFRGRGMEFSEVRPYQPGDDVRNIDWRVTARTQSPYTKLFQEEKERPVFLLLDQRSPMFFGSQNAFKSVYAAELACVIAWAAMNNNDRIGALIFGDRSQKDLRARRGKHAVLNFIHALHEYNTALNSPIPPEQHNSLKTMLTDLRRIARPGSAIFIISDFHDYDSDCEESLVMLARHTDVNVFQLRDKLETQLPNNKVLSISDGSNRLTISQNARKLQKEFKNNYSDKIDSLRASCQRSAITFAAMDVAIPLASCVHDTFESTLSLKRRAKRNTQTPASDGANVK